MKKEKNLKRLEEKYKKFCNKQYSIELFEEFARDIGYLTDSDNYETNKSTEGILLKKDLKRYLSDPFLAQEIEQKLSLFHNEKITGCNLFNYLFSYAIDEKLGILKNSTQPLLLIDQQNLENNKFRVKTLINVDEIGYISLVLVNGFPLALLVIQIGLKTSKDEKHIFWKDQFLEILKKYKRYARLIIMFFPPKVLLIPFSDGFLPRIDKNITSLEIPEITIMDKLFWETRGEDIINNSLFKNDIWELLFRLLPKHKFLMFLQNNVYFSDSYPENETKWCEAVWKKEICDSIEWAIDSLKIYNYVPLELKISEHPSLPAITVKKILNDYDFRNYTILSYFNKNNSENEMKNLIFTSQQFLSFRLRGEIDFNIEELNQLKDNSIYFTSFEQLLENVNIIDQISKPTLHLINLNDLLSNTKNKYLKEKFQKVFKEKDFNSLNNLVKELLNISSSNRENNKFLIFEFI